MDKISKKRNHYSSRIKSSEHIYAVKLKTESNGLGVLKTIIVLGLIAAQMAALALSYIYFLQVFKWYTLFSIVVTILTCVYVLSSDSHGQAKATWIFFLLPCFGFGYVFYFLSDRHVLFARKKKKYAKIYNQTKDLQTQKNTSHLEGEIKNACDLLYNCGNFVTHFSSKSQYFSSGASLYDDMLENLALAQNFIFIEYYIISNGVLFERFMKILSEKAKQGVDVRIIYDDMGSHGTLKRRNKKAIKKAGIKLQDFNRLIPIFNIALNLRDHRKIVIIDGKIAYTGGTNLADEYINEKRMHGYWKDCGIKIEGRAVDNFTIEFLKQWQFLSKEEVSYSNFINLAKDLNSDGVVVPFVSGPDKKISIAQNIYSTLISNAQEKLYIMTPYFVPDETIFNLLKNKAQSGVDVRIFLPGVPDKRFVYIVSRNNAEKLMESGVKVFTMTSSFIHSKVVYTENAAVVGSINMDLRSFYQQFESAVYTSEKSTLNAIEKDCDWIEKRSKQITTKNCKRNKLSFKILAGLFKLISPFM